MKLKLVIDSNSNRVIYAEAEKEFVDFVLYLLAMPVGTMVKLLSGSPILEMGSLGSLRQSVQMLHPTYLQQGKTEDSILNSYVHNLGAEIPSLLANLIPSPPSHQNLYICETLYSQPSPPINHLYVSDDSPQTNRIHECKLTRRIRYTNLNVSASRTGYVRGAVPYMVMDNLEVKPLSTNSTISVLTRSNVLDMGSIQELDVEVGQTKALKLLRASIETKNVLTSVFLQNTNA